MIRTSDGVFCGLFVTTTATVGGLAYAVYTRTGPVDAFWFALIAALLLGAALNRRLHHREDT